VFDGFHLVMFRKWQCSLLYRLRLSTEGMLGAGDHVTLVEHDVDMCRQVKTVLLCDVRGQVTEQVVKG